MTGWTASARRLSRSSRDAGIPKRKYFPKGGRVYVNSIEGHEVEAGLPAPDRLPARPGVHQFRRRDDADVQGIARRHDDGPADCRGHW